MKRLRRSDNMKCSECEYGEHIKQIDTWFCNANKKKPKRIDRTEVNLDVPCKHIETKV